MNKQDKTYTEADREELRNSSFIIQGVEVQMRRFIEVWNSSEMVIDVVTKLGLKNKNGLSPRVARIRNYGIFMKSFQGDQYRRSDKTTPKPFNKSKEPAASDEMKKKRETVFHLYYSEDQAHRMWRQCPLFRTLDGKVVQASMALDEEYGKGPLRQSDTVYRGQGKMIQPGVLRTRAKKTSGLYADLDM